MLNVSKKLKMFALASVAGIGLAAAAATTASADYTRCDADSDRCWRVHTGYYDYDRDDYRYNTGYGAYNYGRRWMCDADGDNCHWVYSNYYYRPHVGVTFGWHD